MTSPKVIVNYKDQSIYAALDNAMKVVLVGPSHKGTTDPYFVTNADDFISEFGVPSVDSYLHYAALNFLKYGRQLWVKRVASATAAYSQVAVKDSGATDTTLTVKAKSKGDWLEGYKIDIVADTSINLLMKKSQVTSLTFAGSVAQPTNVTGVVLSDPTGSTGNFALTFTYTGTLLSWGGGTAVNVGAGGTFTLTSSTADTIQAVVTQASLPTENKTDASIAVTATVTSETPDIPGVIFTSPSGSLGTHLITYTYTSDSNITIKLDTGSASASIHNLTSVAITSGSNSVTAKIVKDGFKILVKDQQGLLLETIDKLSKDPSSIYYHVDRVPTISDYIITTDEVTNYKLPAATTTTLVLTGGNAGIAGITAADYVTGIDEFKNVETYDIDFIAAPGVSDRTVVSKLLSFAELRADCFAFIDSPSGLTPTTVVNWVNGEGSYTSLTALNTKFGAIAYDWLKYYDAYSAGYIYLPPSVAILDLYAQAYKSGNQYQAIAGYNRGRIMDALDVQTAPTEDERDYMYSDDLANRVNPIAKFTRDGIILFGEMTLQKSNTSTNRIHAMITLNYLVKQIRTLFKSSLFEVTDAVLWRSLQRKIDPVLDYLKSPAVRGLYDARFVCDESTNTASVINQNKVKAKLYVKFTKTAEVIEVDIIGTDTAADFTVL